MSDAVAFTDAPSKTESSRLTALGNEVYAVDSEIKRLEELLKATKARKNELVMKELPDYMRDIQQDRVGLPGADVDLVLEPFYHANIAAEWPEEQREAAFKWLEDNGHGDLIKTIVTVQFSRRLLKQAQAVVEKLKKMKIPGFGSIPEPEISMAVPWNTLTSFVREQTEGGLALPLEVLGATIGSIVKIKPRRK